MTSLPVRPTRWFSRLARLFAATGLLLALASFVRPPALAAPAAITWPSISLAQVATGLNQPVYVTHAGDGSGRLFIVERAGIIRILSGGSLLAAPFLNLSGTGANIVRSTGGEEGLLSVAFPPGFPTGDKNHFYVYYTSRIAPNDGNNIVARYELTSANVANPASAEIVLVLQHPGQSNHNGGQLQFGPVDGYLYVATGDGGDGGDPPNNAQNLNSPLGKILRLDVETGNPATYTNPATNPFVGVAGLDEIWAWGLRNPWRFSFDRQTHDLYIGDVGQSAREEVNFQAAASAGGVNYGWRCYEANQVYNATGCGPIGNYTFPLADYSHSLGCSISGGYVYRGTSYPSMQGFYFYGDYCSGRIWGLKQEGTWQSQELLDSSASISSFGEDQAGKLYLTDLNGTLYEVRAPTTTVYADANGVCGGNSPCYTSLQSAIDAAGAGTTLNVSPGTFNQSVTLNRDVNVVLLPGAHELNGSLAVSAGTFTAPQGTYYFSGNLTVSGTGQYLHNNGTANFEGGITQTLTGNPVYFNVTIDAGTTVTTGSGTMTVLGTLTNNGVLRRNAPAQSVTTGGGAVAFTDALNRPAASLTSTGGTSLGNTTVTVTQHQSPAAVSCGGASIGGTPVLRHFNITPANLNGVAATVRLYYDPATEGNGTNPNLLAIYHCTGSNWEVLSGSYTRGTDGATGLNYIVLTNVTSFSPFALSTGVPTAVQISGLAARQPVGPWLVYALGGAVVSGAALAWAGRRKRHSLEN